MKHKLYSGTPKAGKIPFVGPYFMIKLKNQEPIKYFLHEGDNLETITNNKYFQIKVNDCTIVLLPLENLDYFMCNFWSVNDGKND